MNKVIIFLGVFLLFLSSSFAQETLTISTYYPAPFGVYNQLVTNTLGVGDNNSSGGIDAGDAPLVTDAGDVWIAEAGYPVRYHFSATGIDEDGSRGAVTWAMDLTDVNAPLTIEPPM